MKLNIMTYNIASGRCYTKDEDITPEGGSIVKLEACAQVIREEAPDICGINEINHYLPDYPSQKGMVGTPLDQTKYLADYTGLGQHYFGKAIHFAGRGDYGNSVISRFAVKEAGVVGIPDPEYYDESAYYETRGITKVKLDVAGGITVLQVHVGLAVTEQQNAVVTLCRVIDETEGPLILMGDFNMCPNNFLLDRLRQRLKEVKPFGEGYIRTFPSWTHEDNVPREVRDLPYCKIDYIFVSDHFRVLDCRVLQRRVSDHMPMVAQLEI